MELRILNTFIQVAELGSFTKAAEKLNFSQPTVSFQIKQLENELGVQLFDRIGHTVSLTDSGRAALAYAQGICRMSEEMTKGASSAAKIEGRVRVAMADSLCIPIICKEFATLRQKYPHVSLKVMTAGTKELFSLLDHNEVDMVCTLDSHVYSNDYVISSEEKIGAHFVCSSKDKLAKRQNISAEELVRQPFLLTERGMSYRRLLDERMASRSIEIKPTLEISSADLISKLVEEGMGVSFLPDYVTESAVREGNLVRLSVKGFEVELWKQLIYRRDKWLSEPIRAVIEHLSKITLK